ncbi:MAG: 4-(cytidine 5'-diphospho)-2-C-methyl-D-erythritol kinase [Clostridiaceae bacterium]
MRVKAYAKVNLALDITGKLDNGYHELNMIMQTINIYDLIDIEKAKDGIEIKCNKKYIPTDKRNTVYKAAQILIDSFNIKSGISIKIKKTVPSQAGLGGGSSDAAAVLKTMNQLFNLKIDDNDLARIAKDIGADIPFFIYGGTALCQGIGEKITKLKEFKNKTVLLVKPGFGVNTREAYGLYDLEKDIKHPDIDLVVKALEQNNIKELSINMGNVLESVVINKYHEIEKIKGELTDLGASGALMTGSGSTVFSLFDEYEKGLFAYKKIKNKYKEVFLTKTI